MIVNFILTEVLTTMTDLFEEVMDPTQELINAIGVRNYQKVLELVDDTPNLNVPLVHAVRVKDIPIITLLLDKGANPSCQPLTEAVISKDAELVKLLLNRGANADESAALWETFDNDVVNEEIFRILVENGAKPNYKDESEFTIIHALSQIPNVDLLRFALQYVNTSILNDEDIFGDTPLNHAIIDENMDNVLEILFRDITQKTKDIGLITAAVYDRPDFVELLLKFGADPNYIDPIRYEEENSTALVESVKRKHKDVFNILIKTNISQKIIDMALEVVEDEDLLNQLRNTNEITIR